MNTLLLASNQLVAASRVGESIPDGVIAAAPEPSVRSAAGIGGGYHGKGGGCRNGSGNAVIKKAT